MKQVLIYLAALAAITVSVLLAAGQFFNAHKKNQLPHVANNAMLLSGCIMAVLLGGMAVYGFTGKWEPLIIFAALVALAVGPVYAWRIKRDKEAEKVWEALMAEEEQQARETVEKDPANAAAWARLSQMRQRRGDLRGALELFAKACELEPTTTNLSRLEDLREAVSALPPGPERDKAP